MPSQYDNTYHWEYSKPTYDTKEDQIKFQTIKEADYVLERKPPREPTRDEEVEYLDWLNDQFLHDPWITNRFRKYMAGPKRWPWKNSREIKNQYQYTYLVNFIIGGFLSWPLAVWIGRRSQRYQGGVPSVPRQKLVPDFPNLDPTSHARKQFRKNFFLTCFCGGIAFAYLTVDPSHLRNSWYNRPDLKPFPAMVPKEEMDITERTMLEAHYQSFRNKEYKDAKKTRSWYRLFFPLDGDYSVKRNPYSQTHRDNVYNPKDGYYATIGTNHYRHHTSE